MSSRPIKLTNHVCGAAMGLLGFAISLFVGLLVDNPFNTVITRGLAVLACFYLLGFFLVSIGQKAIEENFENERKDMEAKIAKEAAQKQKHDITEENQDNQSDSEQESQKAVAVI